MKSKKNVSNSESDKSLEVLTLDKIFNENKHTKYYSPLDVIIALHKVVNLEIIHRTKVTRNENFSLGFFKDLMNHKNTNYIFSKTSNGVKKEINPQFYFELSKSECGDILRRFTEPEFNNFFSKHALSFDNKITFE
jgi:hypothetical protein